MLRRWADVVLVGGGTWRADRAAPRHAARAADDGLSRLRSRRPAIATRHPGHDPWRGPASRWCSRPAAPAAGATSRRRASWPALSGDPASTRRPSSPGVSALQAVALLLEGGPRLAASFLARRPGGPLGAVHGAGRPRRRRASWPRGSSRRRRLHAHAGNAPAAKTTSAVWDRVPFELTRERLAAPDGPGRSGPPRAEGRDVHRAGSRGRRVSRVGGRAASR